MAEPVLTKKQFVRLYERGAFGNHTETWPSYLDWFASGVRDGLFHLRNRVIGGPTYYGLTELELMVKYYELCPDGHSDLFYISRMAPNCYVFNGEVARTYRGLELTYSLVPKPMRDALREQTLYANGLRAKLILEQYLDPGDYDWIMELLQEYDGHVVEFSHYAVPCGTLNRRMIVWETRLY